MPYFTQNKVTHRHRPQHTQVKCALPKKQANANNNTSTNDTQASETHVLYIANGDKIIDYGDAEPSILSESIIESTLLTNLTLSLKCEKLTSKIQSSKPSPRFLRKAARQNAGQEDDLNFVEVSTTHL